MIVIDSPLVLIQAQAPTGVLAIEDTLVMEELAQVVRISVFGCFTWHGTNAINYNSWGDSS